MIFDEKSNLPIYFYALESDIDNLSSLKQNARWSRLKSWF